ncbi:MAG: hypothetical protein ABSA03_09110 [Streptosporangiaceae bacterium]|jgi:hypothetical protein
MSQRQILDELHKQGITTLDELAQKAADDSAARASAAAPATAAQADYIYTGKDFTFIHSE